MNINEVISKAWGHVPGVCYRCKRVMRAEELNWEARVHHKAKGLECIDRKSCERVVRKLRRKRINAR